MPGDHPMNRTSDRGPVKHLSALMADYRSIIWPIVVLALALGFRFNSPSTRLDKVEALQKEDHANVTVLVKLQCFNTSFNDEQRAMAGLEGCANIRQGLPDPSLPRK